ncbi:MAG: hypothetical protein ACRD19_11180 [Terriglobia bacterium]
MQTKRFGTRFQYPAIVLIGAAVSLSQVRAQISPSHQESTPSKQLAQAQGPLLKVVRDSTERFKEVWVAEAAGYHLLFGCVTGPDAGAMGLHYVNMTLLNNPPLAANGEPDATRPQIVIYEPLADGSLHLIGADYLIIAGPWDNAHPGQGAPQMMGQIFQYWPSPNRFGLPAFYTLHVWAWKNNPNGAFVNWNPNVSCAAFSGQAQ